LNDNLKLIIQKKVNLQWFLVVFELSPFVSKTVPLIYSLAVRKIILTDFKNGFGASVGLMN